VTDRDALLEVIRRDPADDLPRLAFADLLDEQGEAERAEFIRVQVELEPLRCWSDGTLGEPLNDAEVAELRRYNALRRRERELMTSNVVPIWRSWAAPANRLTPQGALFSDHVFFRRGFVWRVHCTLAAWREHGPAVVRAQPIERAELSDRRPWVHAPDTDYVLWFRGGEPPWGLPGDLFDLLPGGEPSPRHGFSMSYGGEDSSLAEDAARDALSVALLALARETPVQDCTSAALPG
jgi:uncharacterized protein (TIGR02996 family)